MKLVVGLAVVVLVLAGGFSTYASGGFFSPGATLGNGPRDPAAVTYTGPGDIVSGATAWYGLRCYNAAKASASQAINVRRASDNTTQDVGLTAGCDLDIASANSFAGTDATCTGTIASTTLTCSGASSTPHARSTLIGAGITQPSYIVSCGTFTAGAGTCTLNSAQTVSVGETITMQYGLYVTEVYDQTGNTRHATQATAATQPQLFPSCISSLPCMFFNASQALAITTFAVLSQPFSVSAVGERTAVGGVSGALFSWYNGGTQPILGWTTSSNQMRVYAGTVLTASATDSAAHAVQGVFNGASSVLNVDDTNTTGAAGASATTANVKIGEDNTAADPLTGYIMEVGGWPVGFTSGNRTSLCHNEYLYWTTSVSC